MPTFVNTYRIIAILCMYYLLSLHVFLFFLLSIEIFKHCTEVRFSSFLSGRFTTMAVMNPPEKKLKKRTSVHWFGM